MTTENPIPEFPIKAKKSFRYLTLRMSTDMLEMLHKMAEKDGNRSLQSLAISILNNAILTRPLD